MFELAGCLSIIKKSYPVLFFCPFYTVLTSLTGFLDRGVLTPYSVILYFLLFCKFLSIMLSSKCNGKLVTSSVLLQSQHLFNKNRIPCRLLFTEEIEEQSKVLLSQVHLCIAFHTFPGVILYCFVSCTESSPLLLCV